MHLLRVQGFYFCPAAYQPHTSVYSGFYIIHELYRPRNKTAHGALQWLSRLFFVFCRCCMAVYPAILHHLRHAGAHTRARTACTDTRYHHHARTLYRSAHTAYYNKVYNGAGARPVIDPCHTVQHTANHASPAGSASPPVQGQPGDLQSGTGQLSRHTGSA